MNPPPFSDHMAPVHLKDSVTSTNDLARERILSGSAISGETFIAREQTAGRGRLGRSWYSPRDSHLYLSVIAIPDCPPQVLPQLSLAAGVAMAEALRGVCGLSALLKWPNDLVCQRRKLGGILCESVLVDGAVVGVAVGVGVNMEGTRDDFPEDVPHATSVAVETGGEGHLDRLALAARFLAHFTALTATFDDEARKSMRTAWEKRAWLGAEVQLEDGSAAEVLGLDEHGALKLQRTDGTRFTMNNGELIWVHMGME